MNEDLLQDRATGLATRRNPGRPANIALVGFGTVGQAVVRLLRERPQPTLRLTAICNRDIDRKRVEWAPSDVRWVDSVTDVLADDVDIVVELMGGLEPAGALVRRALESGRSVVTANKQLISRDGRELAALAARRGAQLRFEAAVGGAIPLLRAIEDGLASDRLTGLAGILNGTCNFVLSRMEESGAAFDEVLSEAQRLGLAEADPEEDINGSDARAKLTILASVALNCHPNPDEIECRSIEPIESIDFSYARRLHSTIRQIAWAQRGTPSGELAAAVRPMLVSAHSPLARVSGSDNLVTVDGEFSGTTGFLGAGAGGSATAVSVVSDLVSVARHTTPAGAGLERREPLSCRVTSDFVATHYLRFNVHDRPGIIAEIATALSRHSISIDAVLQEPGHQRARLPFVITLDPCRVAAVEAALEEIGRLDFHVQPPLHLPILSSSAKPEVEPR